jgi:Double zinc ribbon
VFPWVYVAAQAAVPEVEAVRDGRQAMDDEQQRQQAEQRWEEFALRKLQEEFHQFLHECQACQRDIAPHWQVCAHCGARLATHCPGCGNPLPPAGAQVCARCGVALPPLRP